MGRKITVWIFQATNKQNFTRENLDMAKKDKRENESLQIAAKNNAIRTNYTKAKIDKTQQNCRCRLCGDRDKTINYIIRKCSKLAQKEYKTRHDRVGKVINLELSKKFRFDNTSRWYMHNQESVPKNETQNSQEF